MRYKPWPIVVLAFLHFIAPLFNLLLSAQIMRESLPSFIHELRMESSPWELILDGGLLPLAGFAIYRVKPWSYPIFLTAIGWVSYHNYVAWRDFPNYVSGSMILFLTLINVSVVSYFLLSEVRATYYNSKLRWWEAQVRYVIDLEAIIEDADNKTQCIIGNISQGGAFIRTQSRLENNQIVQLRFGLLGEQLDILAKVVYTRWQGERGYGLQFYHTEGTEQALHQLVRMLPEKGIQRQDKRGNAAVDFAAWLSRLARSGQGWKPELPPSSTAPAKPPYFDKAA